MKVIKITKAGYLYILITIFLGFAAINTGNNLLYLVTSSLLGFMGISGFFGKRNIENLEISLNFPDNVFANTNFSLKIKIKNCKILPSFLVKIRIKEKTVIIPFIKSKEIIQKHVIYKFENRGINNIEKVYVSSSFPFNFFIRSKKYKLNYQKIVYPQPLKFSINSIFNEKNEKPYNFTDKKGFTGDLINIREYKRGDPVKLLHWKISSKMDKLFIKELSMETNKLAIIDFNEIKINDIEKKLSFFTYLVLKYPEISLKFENRIIKNKQEILKFLALFKL